MHLTLVYKPKLHLHNKFTKLRSKSTSYKIKAQQLMVERGLARTGI